MGAGKNKNHRKKRISKHVLEAEGRRKQAETESTSISPTKREGTAADAPSTVSSEMKKSKTKDPELASSYVTLWNYDRVNNTKEWKFNKNTQSWLLRHMYDFDKVLKSTFALFVEYLSQGGDGLRARAEEDAKSRARRYKEWEKNQPQKGGEGAGGKNTSQQKNDAESKEKEVQSSSWSKLDDHDKRKEYKRARKVLDALKAVREDSKTE